MPHAPTCHIREWTLALPSLLIDLLCVLTMPIITVAPSQGLVSRLMYTKVDLCRYYPSHLCTGHGYRPVQHALHFAFTKR
ncbi:hypothetical protein BC629DRAFT_1518039 [Irpex lacteus]|nr:hypothetical protein BC629DRAFT_1518039 [Irpex lacteus]